MTKEVLIIGGGFAGLTAAQNFFNKEGVKVTLIDRRNHHLFQPLLYQVAMAGLSPSDISVPLRRLFSRSKNVVTLMAEIEKLNLPEKQVLIDKDWVSYDYLILACGAKHYYFGNDHWEEYAPGLKTIEQATEIRRRILLAFELAEKEKDEARQRTLLTFVVVGGGPTGVELAGSIAEMSKKTLMRDYKNVDLKKTRVVLVEAGNRLISAFPKKLSAKAKAYLESYGVEVILGKMATDLTRHSLRVGGTKLDSSTIIWAAGVKPSKITDQIPAEKARDGRVLVSDDLSIPDFKDVFVLGDQAAFSTSDGGYLPGLAPVAIQQGKFVAKNILRDIQTKPRRAFRYFDKGIMATIGRSRAVVYSANLQISGLIAWLMWVVVHIAFLVHFKNRFFVMLQWAWSYFNFGRGARLIVHKTWKFYSGEKIPITKDWNNDNNA